METIEDLQKRREISYSYNLGIYFDLMKRHKWLIFFMLALIIVHEVKQVLDKYLFKVIVDNGADFSTGLLSLEAFTSILWIILAVYIVATLTSVVGGWLRIHILNRLEIGMMVDLKEKFFNHIITLSHGFHTSHKTGSLISRLIRGGGAIERLTDVIMYNFVTMFFQLLVVTLSLIYFDWVSAVVICTTFLVFVIYSFYIQRLQQVPNLLANRREDIEKGNVSDIFTNIDSIKYFGKENYIKRRYSKLANKSADAAKKHWDYFRWMSAGQSLIIGIGTFFVILFPLLSFLEGNITLGTVTFVYTIYIGLMGHMFGFVHGLRGFYRSMADFQDLFEYGKFENDIKDQPGAKKLKIEKGKIEFKDVSFKYHKRNVIDDVKLNINPGEKVALVGHSGSGKTTLVKLLYRFYDIQEGRILIDGHDIREFKQDSLRNELSVVPQECVLFDDTIYNNIAFSNLGASRKEVMKAMKFAQLDSFVKELPLREKTVVGERGVKLSGGEKQRVSIARAILANKKILVLDEATSALDSKTEHEIQKDLQKLMKGRTSIIIAHRLSTIMNADKIVVTHRGKIVQIGTHRQLINQDGVYKELWNLQKGGYIEE